MISKEEIKQIDIKIGKLKDNQEKLDVEVYNPTKKEKASFCLSFSLIFYIFLSFYENVFIDLEHIGDVVISFAVWWSSIIVFYVTAKNIDLRKILKMAFKSVGFSFFEFIMGFFSMLALTFLATIPASFISVLSLTIFEHDSLRTIVEYLILNTKPFVFIPFVFFLIYKSFVKCNDNKINLKEHEMKSENNNKERHKVQNHFINKINTIEEFLYLEDLIEEKHKNLETLMPVIKDNLVQKSQFKSYKELKREHLKKNLLQNKVSILND